MGVQRLSIHNTPEKPEDDGWGPDADKVDWGAIWDEAMASIQPMNPLLNQPTNLLMNPPVNPVVQETVDPMDVNEDDHGVEYINDDEWEQYVNDYDCDDYWKPK